MKTSSSISLSVLAGLTLSLVACDFGGLNQNQQEAGNQDDGVNLGFGDIAIDPTGTYFLSRNDGKLVHGNILTGGAKVLPGVDKPVRLAFDEKSEIVYVTTEGSGGDELIAYDVRNRKQLWGIAVDIEDKTTNTNGVVTYPLLTVSEDNQHLLLSHRQELELIDLTNGKTVRSEIFGADVVDVDLTPDGSRVLVTTEHDWKSKDGEDVPETKIVSVPREPEGTGSREEIEVPNCADELVVAPDGGHAFLAPTTCNKDPISVIDLHDNSFVRNLPGFGPVAQSPSGDEIVGFLDLDEVDASLFDDPADVPSGEQFHMMFIDTATLTYDFMQLGDTMPRYAMTPDGKVLLVDSTGWFEDERLRVLDIPSRTIESASGPVVQLDDFVITSDSKHVYLLDGGLFDLDIPARDVDAVSVGFDPENINITPTDTFLLLRENSTRIQIFDIAKGEIARAVEF